MAKPKQHKAIEVKDSLFTMGHTLSEMFDTTKDVRVAMAAVAAFNVGIKTQQSELAYKKLTGTPSKIEFFED
jgi:hypothetical protein